MPDLTLPYDILNDTNADASTVQANFVEIEQYVNGQVVRIDGANTMVAPLRLFGDPVDPSDAVRLGFLNSMLPVGVVLPYAGTAVPGGQWAIANGTALATATYPDLFAAIGYTHGGAAGTFNLPNFAGKVPIGQSTVAPFTTVGATGGNKDLVVPAHTHPHPHTHDLDHSHTASSSSENLAHTHPLGGTGFTPVGGEHIHNSVASGAGIGFPNRLAGPAGNDILAAGTVAISWFSSPAIPSTGSGHSHQLSGNTGAMSANGTHDHNVTVNAQNGASQGASTANTSSTGVSPTNANLPPYIVVNYIIRVL